MRTDEEEMLDDLRKRREFCMVTISACKKVIATSDTLKAMEAVAILAGLAEIKRVIKDYYGTI